MELLSIPRNFVVEKFARKIHRSAPTLIWVLCLTAGQFGKISHDEPSTNTYLSSSNFTLYSFALWNFQATSSIFRIIKSLIASMYNRPNNRSRDSKIIIPSTIDLPVMIRSFDRSFLARLYNFLFQTLFYLINYLYVHSSFIHHLCPKIYCRIRYIVQSIYLGFMI